MSLYEKNLNMVKEWGERINTIKDKNYIKYLKTIKNDKKSLLNIKWDKINLTKIQIYNLLIEAITNNVETLNYINLKNLEGILSEDQINKLFVRSVKQDGFALEFIENQTEEICLEAVKENWHALLYVKDNELSNEQLDKIYIEAIKVNGLALIFVKKQTLKLCLLAVKENWRAISFVERQTDEICMEAVKRDSLALKYVKNQTPEIYLIAVKQNGLALEYVDNQTDEICLEAVKQNREALKYIKDKKKYEKILKILSEIEGINTIRQTYINFLKEFNNSNQVISKSQ